MKTKNLIIIFILFLLIALASGLAVFLTQEKNERPVVAEKQSEPVEANAIAPEKNKIPPAPFNKGGEKAETPVEEKIKAVMIISGTKYETKIKAGGSAYELMEVLKQENKINFAGKNYSGLGFFVEEINGLKNNPAGENWLYYVNGQLSPVGISNYKLKNGDVIEWKYEKKSF
ncbi:MAG: DUF4430 domain-containing protein [Patescibacteria group bacterium]|nr:DUF4430 domain-containing protein [Patescibacteria group bacterium]